MKKISDLFGYGDEREDESQQVIKSVSSIMLIEPTTIADSSKAIDYMKQNKPIIVNLVTLKEKNDIDAQRIFDMICGAIYFSNGMVNTITDDVYLFSPKEFIVENYIKKEEL